jgi:hypothetical protein
VRLRTLVIRPAWSPSVYLKSAIPISPFVQHALALLARLFRYGEINYLGGFINLATGAASALKIDPQCWKRTRGFGKRSSQIH